MNYPKYYRKEGRCLKRETDTTGREVRIPDNARLTLPLIMSDVTFPNKDRFDQEVSALEEVTQDVYEQYILAFIGRVEKDVKDPMVKYKIALQQKDLLNQPHR